MGQDILSFISVNDDPHKFDGTHIDEDTGLHVCDTCGTPRELVLLNGKKVFMLCKCLDEKRNQEEQRQRDIERQHAFDLRQQFISRKYRDVYLSDDDGSNQRMSRTVKKYVEQFKEIYYPKNLGIMFYGNVGGGKTHYASIIANELCKRGNDVMMYSEQELISKASDFETRDDFFKNVSKFDLLVVDDFNATNQSEFNRAKILEVIDTRYASGKPMIITTNTSREEMISDANDRTPSRLLEVCYPIKIEGNRRIEKAKENYNKYKKYFE